LAGLHQKRGAWGDMVPLLRHRAEIETNLEARAALFLSVADLLEVQEGDAVGAIEAYQNVLAADRTNEQALYSLESLYRRCELWAELLGLLAVRVQLENDPAQKLSWLLDVARVWDEKLGDAAQSEVAYRQMLEVDASSIDALEGLERLYRGAGDYDRELALLENELQLWPDHADYVYSKMEGALHEAGRWEPLVETYRQHLITVDDPARRVELRCALAEVYEQHLNDASRAREAFEDVLAERPDESRALDGLARLTSTG
jgi:tetratricopeptide (TPR) repeat protein